MGPKLLCRYLPNFDYSHTACLELRFLALIKLLEHDSRRALSCGQRGSTKDSRPKYLLALIFSNPDITSKPVKLLWQFLARLKDPCGRVAATRQPRRAPVWIEMSLGGGKYKMPKSAGHPATLPLKNRVRRLDIDEGTAKLKLD